MKRRAAVHTLGCKVNYYESEKIKDLLKADGFEIVDFAKPAEVYVINTCSVTAIADKKSRQIIHRARRKNEKAIVVAMGCYVQKEEVTPESLGCDLILGNNEKHALIDHLHSMEQKVWRRDINDPSETYEELYAERDMAETNDRTRAFIKIQDGCNQFCSYCIIPYVRGRTRSRSKESIIKEVLDVCSRGFQEVVLTGIHLSSYQEKDTDLIALCEAIDRETSIKRLRMGSLEPRVVTEDFVRRLSALPSVCPHFHLSLQSGNDAVLARMNRKYTTEEFAQSVAILRNYFKDPAITTDVIAGFPGETEEEFLEGKRFLERIHFYEMHVFPFSAREGTPAARMAGQIINRIRQARAAELIALAEKMSEEYRNLWKGRQAEVLFEEQEEKDGDWYWTGFTKEYIRVYYKTQEKLDNCIRKIII